MHTKSKYSWLGHIDFMIVDLISMLFSFAVAYYINFGTLNLSEEIKIANHDWYRLVIVISMLNIIINFAANPYRDIFKRSYYMEIIKALQLTFYNMIFVAIFLYVFKIGADYSRAVMIMTYCFYFAGSCLAKFIWKKLIVSGTVKLYNSKLLTMFVVCQSDSAELTLKNIAAGDFDPYEIKGLHFTDDDTSDEFNGIPVIGAGFSEYVIKNNIDDVMIAVQPSCVDNADYKKLVDNAVNVHLDIDSMIGLQTEDQFISDVGICKTVSVGAFTFSPGQLMYLIIKRVFDIVFGIIGIVFFIPIVMIIKLLTLMSGDTASIFYRQKRIGLGGKPIEILKLRSMVPNADEVLKELLKEEKYRLEWEANQKLSNDPRITKVGRVIRKLSIDELGQLVNVIKGDMSFVGPRPLVEGELEAHGGLKIYQKVKPGITGWWGCNGRSNIEYRERLELEYYYIKHFSMYLDILCVFRTIFAVLKKDGAE